MPNFCFDAAYTFIANGQLYSTSSLLFCQPYVQISKMKMATMIC